MLPGKEGARPSASAPTNGDSATLPSGVRLPTEPDARPLGELLRAAGAIDQAQLDAALQSQADIEEESRPRIGEMLLAGGAIHEQQLIHALSVQTGFPLADVHAAEPVPEATDILPEARARELHAVPIRRVPDGFVIGVAEPTIPGLREQLASSVGTTIHLEILTPSDLQMLVDRTYSAVAELGEFVRAFEARAQVSEAAAPEAVDENAPVVQVVSRLLSQAVRDRASDVHIEPMGDRVRVRNRIDGALHEVLSLPQSMAQALSSRIKIMAGLNIVERRRPQDGQIEARVEGRELDVRVSTVGTVFGEKVVLRILDRQRAFYDLSELGMPGDTAKVYRDIIASPYGMVVCAGPTGSGKTTTLYATLQSIQSDEINVMTVEDPVEYVFPKINQISINEQAGVTFAAGLRSILRQDPDSILVGEIRDVETARIAIQAALTGHFVMSTIHATDATSALHRFLDMGIESFLLASAMLAVVGQRLVRRNCVECTETYEPSVQEMSFYERAGGTELEGPFRRGAGCSFCSHTGFFGRVGVYEVLRITDGMRDLMVRNAQIEDMRRLGVSQGMVPMRDQAVRLVDIGTTTIAEVMRTVYVM